MADVYVDAELATGDNDGTSWANAHQGAAGFQAALDAAAAADVLHVTRDFTLAATLDVDTASGVDGSPIRVIGYNYNGGTPVNDGTKVLIDADSAAVNCIKADGQDMWFWENFEFANATGDNVAAANTPNDWSFVNCDSRDGGGHGFGGGFNQHVYVACRAIDNDGDGFASLTNALAFGCQAIGNGGSGFDLEVYAEAVACVAHGNGADGFLGDSYECHVLFCVSDGNALSGVRMDRMGAVIGCRLTNNTAYGLVIYTGTVIDLANVYVGNGAGTVTGSTPYPNLRGASTRVTAGIAGYEDLANDLFNCRLGAAAWRTELDIGGGNYLRFCPGLPTTIVPRLGGDE